MAMLHQLDEMIHVDKLTDGKKKSRDVIDSKYRMSVEPKVVEGTARLSTVKSDDIEETPFDLVTVGSVSGFWTHLQAIADEIIKEPNTD